MIGFDFDLLSIVTIVVGMFALIFPIFALQRIVKRDEGGNYEAGSSRLLL